MLRRPKSRPRHGFTVVELCGVVALIGVLVALLLPAVQAARENARRTSCSNNLLNVALAVRHYQSVHGHFPVQLHGTDGSETPGADNNRRLSFLVGLLPYVDQMPAVTYLQQKQKRDRSGAPGSFGVSMEVGTPAGDNANEDPEQDWPRNGPEPFMAGYPIWKTEVPTFRCPSDPGSSGYYYGSSGGNNGRTNYAACLGDGCPTSATGPFKQFKGAFVFDDQLAKQTNAAMRGVFVPRVPTSDSDVTDGISYTLLLGEICTSLGDSSARVKPAVAVKPEQLMNDPGLVRTVQQKRRTAGEQPVLALQSWTPVWETTDDPQITVNTGLSGKQERGLNWVDGMPLYTGFNTILPPNRELLLSAARDDCWGVLPPSSYHQGGVNVAMVDGAVRFVGEEIDAGNEHVPTVYLDSPTPPGSRSPFGVWGAMGTRASSELNR
ncbi:MAG: DUF1559 domain-containing protein [Rubripirellula sp.]